MKAYPALERYPLSTFMSKRQKPSCWKPFTSPVAGYPAWRPAARNAAFSGCSDSWHRTPTGPVPPRYSSAPSARVSIRLK
jgi:hypothetical protein